MAGIKRRLGSLLGPPGLQGTWAMPRIQGDDDLDNYFHAGMAGVYPVTSTVANLPINTWGSVEIIPQSSAVAQRFTSWLHNGRARVFTRTQYGGSPTPWKEVGGASLSTDALSSGDLDLDDYFSTDKAGFYRVTSTNVANIPVRTQGILVAIPMTNSNFQFYGAWFVSGEPRVFMRTLPIGGTPTAWIELTGDSSVTNNYYTTGGSRGVISQTQALATFNARLIRHTDEPVPVIFAGSSTTQGNGATTNANRWVNKLTSHLQAKYPNGEDESTVKTSSTGDFSPETGPGIHGYNIGRGGTHAGNYLTDADSPTLAALEPALIIHMVGSNDYSYRRSISTYKADLEHRIAHLSDAISTPHAHVLVHQFQRQDVTNPDPLWNEYADALQEIAEHQPDRVAYVNLSEAFNTTGLDQNDPFGFLGPDNVHTNDAGHAFLAHLLAIGLGEK